MILQTSAKKLLRHTKHLLSGRYSPITAVFMVTSRCNLKCPFCYVINRKREDELDLEDIKRFVEVTRPKGVEISGGEPCLYPHLKELIDWLYKKNIDVGMFSNGTLIHLQPESTLKKLEWLRISSNFIIDNEIPFKAPKYPDFLGYSYVYHEGCKLTKEKLENFVNTHRGKYFKINLNVLNPIPIPEEEIVPITTMNVVVQKTLNKKRYDGYCHMALLKPNIEPDGKIYACPCLQNKSLRKKEPGTSIGHVKKPKEYLANGEPIKKCFNCRLTEHNKFVEYIRKEKTLHENFL